MRLVIGLSFLALAGCADRDRFAETKAVMGDHCASCHVIPGVRSASGNVGPPLAGFANRQVIAGFFPNSRANLIRWVRWPQEMLPGNAMPDQTLTTAQASRIADYLYTLD